MTMIWHKPAARNILNASPFSPMEPKTVSDTATVAHPTAPPIGISMVIVNGVSVLENSKLTGAYSGRVLRRQ